MAAKSSFINMTATLLVITAISGVALAYVNQLTQEPKSVARTQKELKALEAVLPEFDNNPAKEKYKIISSNGVDSLEVYPASLKGEPVGVAISSVSHRGFGGDVKIMLGLLENQSIHAIQILNHKETPGFGTKMENESFKSQLYGKTPSSNAVLVTKDGGEVDAITGATISSRAFCDAVQQACNAFNKSVDSYSGSTILNEK